MTTVRTITGLAALRRAALLTQAELAGKVGVHQQALGRWETGQVRPQPKAQRALVVALGCTPAQLLDALEESGRQGTHTV